MTQVNPIWAQVHTVAADGTTSFTPTYLNGTASTGVQVIAAMNRSTAGGGNSAALFGQAAVGSTTSDMTGNLAGVQGYSIFTNTLGNSTGTWVGGEFHGANEHNATGNSTNIYGINAMSRHYGTGTTTNAIAVRATMDLGRSDNATTDGNVSNAIAVYGQIQNVSTAATPGVITNSHVFYADVPVDTAVITTQYGVRILNQGGTHGNITTAYGLNIANQTGAITNNIAIQTGGGKHAFTITANLAAAWSVIDGATNLYVLDSRNSTLTGIAHKFLPPAMTVTSSSGNTYSAVQVAAFTYSTTGTSTVTALNGLALNVAAPTISSAGASATTTASTVYISGAPINAGSGSITNAFALHVVGALRLESTVANGAVATALSSVGPTGAATTVQEWLKVVTANGTRYIPCF